MLHEALARFFFHAFKHKRDRQALQAQQRLVGGGIIDHDGPLSAGVVVGGAAAFAARECGEFANEVVVFGVADLGCIVAVIGLVVVRNQIA